MKDDSPRDKIIAVAGHQRSGVGFKLGVVCTALRQYGTVVDYTHELDLPETVGSVMNYYATEIVFKDENKVTVSYFDKGNIPNQIDIPAEEFGKISNIFYTHSKISNIIKNNFYKQIDALIFTFRDCRDYIVSSLKYISKNADKDASGYGAEKQEMVAKDLTYNTSGGYTQYNLRDIDLAQSKLMLRHFSNSWREYILDYLRLEKTDKIIPISFENKYINGLEDELQKICQPLQLSDDEIKRLEISDKDFGYVDSQKIKKYASFFSSDNIEYIENIAGDVMVCIGYMELSQYSEFISKNNNFTIIMSSAEPDNYYQADIPFILKKLGKSTVRIIDLESETIDLAIDEKYLICTNKKFAIPDNISFDYYPLYKNHQMAKYSLFDLNNKRCVELDEAKNIKDVIYIYHPSAHSDYDLLNTNLDILNMYNCADEIPDIDGKTVLITGHDFDVLISNIKYAKKRNCNILSMYPLYDIET